MTELHPDDPGPGGGADPSERTSGRPERRRAPAIAVLVAIAIQFLIPESIAPGPPIILPTVLAVFLIAEVIVDPGRIDRAGRPVRLLSLGLVVVMAVGAAIGTAALVLELLEGDPQVSSAQELLLAGGLVWVDMVLAFAFVYWEVDGGGPVARWRRPPRYPDLAFPQQLNPDIAAPGWRPIFVDYLYLSFTAAMAFSPTDVMPLARWAKFAMAVESMISVIILSLVIANSVNLLN